MKKILSIILIMVLLSGCMSTAVLAANQYNSDYRQWSQGASSYSRVRAYGCFIVAMAKMIVESGVDTSSSFDPDVFAEWEEANGYITSLTSSVGQNNKLGPQEYAEFKGKKLKYLGPVEYSDDTLWNCINNGYYCIVHIGYKSGYHHYVFVSNKDSINNKELTFYESGASSISIGTMNKSKLLSRYKNSSITTIYVYEGDIKNVCPHSYNDPNTELCNKCGAKYQRIEKSENKKYTVSVKNINLRTVPYSKAGSSNGVSYAGETVTSSLNVINMYGNEWVRITNSKGQSGYTYIGNLKEHNEPNTSNDGTGVTGTVSIPLSWTDLSIRTGPSTNYQIVGRMPQGAKCTVYPQKTSNGWYYVNYNGIWGYASSKQISLNNSVDSNTKTGIVNIPSSWTDLSIRSGPSTNHQIVGGMPNGARCTVYPDKASNGWYYVEYNGVYGYASGNCIKLQ